MPTNIMLLISVILIWGFNWPIVKIVLFDIPPLWLGVLRLLFGMICLFGYLIIARKSLLPTKKDLPILLTVGLLQMGLFTLLINLGLAHVNAGRSAILAYTTPLWVTPVAVLIFGEHFSRIKLFGLLMGALGIVILFDPLSFDWHNKTILISNALILLAAIMWSLAILHTRYAKWHLSAVELAPWQLLIATIMLAISALIFEPNPTIIWTTKSILLMRLHEESSG